MRHRQPRAGRDPRGGVVVPSTERPGGFGEHPVPMTAPAVGNAVFAATGLRLRRLPITPDAVRAARG